MKKINLMCVLLLALAVLVSGMAQAVASNNDMLIISLVNQDPDPASVGDILEVRVGVENIGGDSAENVVLELNPDYPFSIVPGESAKQNIGTIKARQYDSDIKIVKFKVRVDKDATAGAYNLKIKSYQEGNPDVVTQTSLSIDVQSKESAEVIYIDQVELIPGRITPLKFTVNNVGSSPLRDLTFQWENAEDIILPVGSDNTKYIKYIDVGDSAELNFNVIASATADPDLYKLDLKLTYDDPFSGEETEINTKAGVYVGGATDFDVAFSGTSSGESSFSISNIGSVSASSVTVRIPEQPGWRVTGSNSVIIGNLNEGDYTIASFTLQQTGGAGTAAVQNLRLNSTASDSRPVFIGQNASAAAGASTVKLEVVYTDSRGNRNTLAKDVAIDSSSLRASSADSGTAGTPVFGARRVRQSVWTTFWNKAKWVLGAVIVLGLLFFAHKKVKKERIKNPDYNYRQLVKELAAKIKLKKKKSSK